MPTDDPMVFDGEVKPLEIELWGVAGGAEGQQIIQIIAQSWGQAGVKTTIQLPGRLHALGT